MTDKEKAEEREARAMLRNFRREINNRDFTLYDKKLMAKSTDRKRRYAERGK